MKSIAPDGVYLVTYVNHKGAEVVRREMRYMGERMSESDGVMAFFGHPTLMLDFAEVATNTSVGVRACDIRHVEDPPPTPLNGAHP